MKPQTNRRYRVVKDGARLFGWQPAGPYAMNGWGKALSVGDVITCLGHKMGSGSDDVPEYRWGDEHGNHLAIDCTFKPEQGPNIWMLEPADGFLELVED